LTRVLFRLALALLALGPGCGRSAEQREMDALLHAVDALRDAPSEPLAAREALLAALERQPAASPLSAGAKEACVHAYRPLLAASSAESRVRKLLDGRASAGAVDEGALSALADLASAEAKIKESAAAMPGCDTALAELRRAARLGR
jgi:hypothetical protein